MATGETRVILTSPAALGGRAVSPFDVEDPSELVYCCFFRTTEQRADFMDNLRALAREPGVPPDDVSLFRDQAAREHSALTSDGDDAGALVATVRWWMRALRRSYHAYNLTASLAPFNASCLVAFDEQDADSVRFNVARALDSLGHERSRVLGFFGLPDEG